MDAPRSHCSDGQQVLRYSSTHNLKLTSKHSQIHAPFCSPQQAAHHTSWVLYRVIPVTRFIYLTSTSTSLHGRGQINHLLSLPGFLLSTADIAKFLNVFSLSAPLPVLSAVPLLASVPRLYLYLAGNTLTQYVCISSVFSLTAQVSSLHVTLVLTLRKFVSLIFSILYFGNPFTLTHWVGTVLVFGGTLIFTDAITLPGLKSQVSHDKKKD
ncbi:UAA transporter [Trinorchestia longiramus]|nr:UAA transporter [Trinorchestia longiramus]